MTPSPTATHTIIDDLYRYNSWANHRISALCAGLADSQLDEPREMGFGTLRNTFFHILAAEEIWLERWNNVPWRQFPCDAGGLSVDAIIERLDRVAVERQKLVDRQRASGWQVVCHYKDSKGNSYSNRLDGLLVHVANHGIHHRAQALNFLKQFDRKVAVGLDYIFFRLAQPHVRQAPETADSMRQFGLEVETGTSPPVAWDQRMVRNYFAYGDWANQRLLDLISELDDAALDRDWEMGTGTLRKNALHVFDGERWWLRNWTVEPTAFQHSPESTPIGDLRRGWADVIDARNRFLASLDQESSQSVVTALVGPLSIRMPVIESMLQLCGHGTHHRAQTINMLRRTNVTTPGLDYMVWLRETETAC